MNLRFFIGEIATYIKSLENFYELSGITLATKSRSNISLITSYPTTWMHLYAHHGYDQIDPVHLAGFNGGNDYIYWGGDRFIQGLTDNQSKLFEEARLYNIQSGVSFPLKSPHNHQLISLAFPFSETITHSISIHLLNELKSHLQMLGMMLHIEALTNGVLLQKDLMAYVSHHTELGIELQLLMHEINDLLLSLHSFFDQLPTQFRHEGKRLLQTLQLTDPHKRISPTKTVTSHQTSKS